MVEINLFLHDITEITMFTDFARALDAYRARKYAERSAVGLGIEQGLREAVAIVNGEAEAPRRHDIAGTGEALVEAAKQYQQHAAIPPQAQLEEALKAYGRAKGFPAARALLDEYTKGKLGDVPAEKRAELYAKLVAA